MTEPQKKGRKKWLIALVAALTAIAGIMLPPVAPVIPLVAEALGVGASPDAPPGE